MSVQDALATEQKNTSGIRMKANGPVVEEAAKAALSEQGILSRLYRGPASVSGSLAVKKYDGVVGAVADVFNFNQTMRHSFKDVTKIPDDLRNKAIHVDAVSQAGQKTYAKARTEHDQGENFVVVESFSQQASSKAVPQEEVSQEHEGRTVQPNTSKPDVDEHPIAFASSVASIPLVQSEIHVSDETAGEVRAEFDGAAERSMQAGDGFSGESVIQKSHRFSSEDSKFLAENLRHDSP